LLACVHSFFSNKFLINFQKKKKMEKKEDVMKSM